MAVFLERPSVAPQISEQIGEQVLSALTALKSSSSLPSYEGQIEFDKKNQPVQSEIGTVVPKEMEPTKVGLQVYWGRLIFASAFLLIILICGLFADMNKLEKWNQILLNSFDILLGIFVGLLGGDFIASKKK